MSGDRQEGYSSNQPQHCCTTAATSHSTSLRLVLLPLEAGGQGVRVGVVDQGVVAVPPGESLGSSLNT